jgi:alpha-tubulin suppressor-like RCC1 family protein
LVQVHAYNGCEHTLVVLGGGQLISFGYNYRGQLGHGSTSSESTPKYAHGLDGHKVCLVSCSYYHTVVATDDAQVFSFGRNDFGQLGHGDTSDKKQATRVACMAGQQLTSLGCGQYHTMLATVEGRAYTCGKNDYGQLGLESSECPRQPVVLSIMPSGNTSPEIIVQVQCSIHSADIVQ